MFCSQTDRDTERSDCHTQIFHAERGPAHAAVVDCGHLTLFLPAKTKRNSVRLKHCPAPYTHIQHICFSCLASKRPRATYALHETKNTPMLIYLYKTLVSYTAELRVHLSSPLPKQTHPTETKHLRPTLTTVTVVARNICLFEQQQKAAPSDPPPPHHNTFIGLEPKKSGDFVTLYTPPLSHQSPYETQCDT